MIKKIITLILISTLIITLSTISGCNIGKYNTLGNFKSEEPKKLYKDKKYDEAIKSIDSFLEKYPKNKEAIALKAYILIGSGKNDEGLVLLTDLYDNGEKDSTTLNNISWAYNNLHMYEMANKYIDICLKNSPGDSEEFVNKGNALYGLKKYDEALLYYDNALYKDSEDTLALYGKALSLYASEKYSEGLVNFKKYVEIGGTNKSANSYIMNSYLKLKDHNGAIEEFNNQIKKNPDNLSLYISLGSIYEKQGDFEKAISCYDTIIIKKLILRLHIIIKESALLN